MLVHPAQQSPIVAAGPAPRKSLYSNRPSLEKQGRRSLDLDQDSIYADGEPTPNPSPAEEIAGKTGEWCQRNSVALLEACCNRDAVKGVYMPWLLERD